MVGIGQSLISGFQAGEQSRGQALKRARDKEVFSLQKRKQDADFQRFTDRRNMESMVEGALKFQTIIDPVQQDAFLKNRIAEIETRGGDSRDTQELLQMEPADRMTTVKNLITMGERFNIIKPMSKLIGKDGKQTANILDFNHYQSLLKTNPTGAEQFARQVGITEKQKKEIKPTTARQNFDDYNAMPAGPGKEKFGRIIGIKPEETPAEAFKREARVEKVQTEILGAKTTIGLADQILTTENYLSRLAGISGKLPSIPGSTAFDAEVVFNQLKNSLTLDNLSKMSGVLSDSDIKILQSAGAGMELGMSEPAMRKRLNIIKSVLGNKIKRQQKTIKSQARPAKAPKAAPVKKDLKTLSDEELENIALKGI